MQKLKYVIGRIFSINLRNMFATVNRISKKTGRMRIIILIDMIWCGFKYLAGYIDYELFAMYELNAKQRETVLTRGKNDRYIKKLNDRNYWHLLQNKEEFNKKFIKFIGRDFLFLNNENKEEFKKFIINKKEIMVKPLLGACGKGIEKINVSDYQIDDLYEKLLKNKQVLLEEVVIQNEIMKKMHPHSINTLRIVTILKDSQPRVVVSYMRIGNGKAVDNFNSGGMVVPVEVETGKIKYPALDKKGELYEKHPMTGENIIGFLVPEWNEVLQLAQQAASEIPQLGIVGWDVAISEKGPVLIEANHFPGHDIYQLPPHRQNGIGILPVFEKILKN